MFHTVNLVQSKKKHKASRPRLFLDIHFNIELRCKNHFITLHHFLINFSNTVSIIHRDRCNYSERGFQSCSRNVPTINRSMDNQITPSQRSTGMSSKSDSKSDVESCLFQRLSMQHIPTWQFKPLKGDVWRTDAIEGAWWMVVNVGSGVIGFPSNLVIAAAIHNCTVRSVRRRHWPHYHLQHISPPGKSPI